MKFLTLAAAVLVGSLAVAGPAEARPDRHDNGRHAGWNNGHHHGHYKRHHHRHCRTIWRHHHRVRVCR